MLGHADRRSHLSPGPFGGDFQGRAGTAWPLIGVADLYQAWIRPDLRYRRRAIAKPIITADSIILRARLVDGGPYLATFVSSVLRRLIADHYAITAPPVDLGAMALSVGIATLKNRTLSPVVERFLACAREVAASVDGKLGRRALARATRSKVS
jgi:hypothetical protein